jgi:hypothetical protein
MVLIFPLEKGFPAYILLHSKGRLVEQKPMLSSNFRCDKIHKISCYEFGYAFECYLRRTQMFNKPPTVSSSIAHQGRESLLKGKDQYN